MKIASEQEVFHEAMEILLKNLSADKFARFWAALQKDNANYLKIKEQLFRDETVDTLYKKIEHFQENI